MSEEKVWNKASVMLKDGTCLTRSFVKRVLDYSGTLILIDVSGGQLSVPMREVVYWELV